MNMNNFLLSILTGATLLSSSAFAMNPPSVDEVFVRVPHPFLRVPNSPSFKKEYVAAKAKELQMKDGVEEGIFYTKMDGKHYILIGDALKEFGAEKFESALFPLLTKADVVALFDGFLTRDDLENTVFQTRINAKMYIVHGNILKKNGSEKHADALFGETLPK